MGRYPIIRREILRLAKKAVTETKTARKGVRKTGFRLTVSGADSAGGFPVLSLPPCAYTEASATPPPAGVLVKHVAQNNNGFFSPDQHSVVIVSTEGVAWVMGSNEAGQFGLGHTDFVDEWTPVEGLPPLTKTAYARNRIFYLTEDGEVYAAGRNVSGELGVGTTGDVHTPMLVDLPAGVTDVVCSFQVTAHALMDDKTIYSWGNGSAGQFGDGYPVVETFVSRPVVTTPFLNEDVGGDVEQVACGASWTLLRKTDGTVHAFGFLGLTPGDASFIYPFGYEVENALGETVYYAVRDPVELSLGTPDCVDISAGGSGALYIFADGTAKISDVQEGVWQRWTHASPPIADFYPGGPDFPDPGYGASTLYGTVLDVSTAVRGWTRENGAGHAILLEDGSLFSFGRNDRHDIGDGTDTATVDPSVTPISVMYKRGTTSLAVDPISFSGMSTTDRFPSVIGDYYVALADGTLLNWRNSEPSDINDTIGV